MVTPKPVKPDNSGIEEELAQLRSEFQRVIHAEETELTEAERLDKQVERFAELYKDPYDDHDVLRIKKLLPPSDDAPEGWKLGWKSPRVREMRGMRGWIPCKWEDEVFIGKDGKSLLHDYVGLSADTLPVGDRTDSIIRVKDLTLCRIDARYAKARALKHVVETHRRRKASGEAAPQGADTRISSSIGVGMENDHAGKQLERLAGVSLDVSGSKFHQVNKEN